LCEYSQGFPSLWAPNDNGVLEILDAQTVLPVIARLSCINKRNIQDCSLQVEMIHKQAGIVLYMEVLDRAVFCWGWVHTTMFYDCKSLLFCPRAEMPETPEQKCFTWYTFCWRNR